jgi:AcrR family transcriptional regulator
LIGIALSHPQSLPTDSTPAERRRQKVRGAILEAAERVFSVEGEAGLSIRRLAEEIDYSPSAIYKYFGSKDELVDELKEAFFERLMQSVDRMAYDQLSFDQRIHRCFRTYIDVAIERPHHYLAAFSTTGASAHHDAVDGAWAEFQQTFKGQAFGTVVALVEEGQSLGAFDRTLDPVHAAKSLWSSMHGLAQLLIHNPGLPQMSPAPERAMTADTFIAFHVSMLVRSLRPDVTNPDSSQDNREHANV